MTTKKVQSLSFARDKSAKGKVKKSHLKTAKKTEGSLIIPSTSLPLQIKNSVTEAVKNRRPSKFVFIALIIIGLSLLIAYKKSWFVAATVNNAPISNIEVLSRLNKQFRDQTLNQMINEKILAQEASKKGVMVKDSDVDIKITALEKNVGGKEALDGLLAQQGQTRDGLKGQLKLQITIEKLYASEATISAEEVNQFIAENQSQLQATDSAEQTKEAKEILEQQKLGTIFNEKFQQLKQSAKIQIF